MSGLTSLLANLTLPATRDLLAWGAPVVTLGAIAWLVTRTDRIMHHAFPDLEWERNLGWLNIRAERRADRALRWVGYGIVVLLLDALVGIFWAAKDFPRLAEWSDPWVMGDLALRVPALALCLIIWIIYLGCGLLPRLRVEREEAAYRKFRAELKTREEEHDSDYPSRLHAPPKKSRAVPQTATLVPQRNRPRFPGG